MAFFSTVIPSYNRADLICQTLDSVLGQEFDDQEIIVADNGSTDNTIEVLKQYGDRVKSYQQENRGPGGSRNLGARHASGKYIAFLDRDDLWFPWTLATYREAIE